MTPEDWIVFSLQVSAASRLVSALMAFTVMGFLRPSRPNYPTVRLGFRVALAFAGTVLAYNGVDLLYRTAHRPPTPLLSGYALSIMFLAFGYFGLMEVLGSWLPAKMRRRIERWRSLPPCVKRAKVMADRRRATLVAAGTHPLVYDDLDDLIPDGLRERD